MLRINEQFKALIPPLGEEEYAQLERNIVSEGVRDPLVAWNGVLVDGHNRFEICQKHGLDYAVVDRQFADDNAAKEWIILNQFGRRNLSAYARSVLALKLKPVIAERAKEKQGERTDLSQKSVECSPVDTQKEIAKAAGVSHDTIAKVEVIEREAPPEVKQQIKRGETSINKAYQALRQAKKKRAVEERFADASPPAANIDIDTADQKFSIIYADPPWRYWESGNKNQSNHYPTMTIDEIKGLPVARIADDNAVLFLWVTYPILREAFDVIEAWGFSYSTCGFCWVKENKRQESPFVGCGAWTRANSELCLIATRGSVMRLDASVSQVIQSPIMEHSKKPEEAYERIEQLVGRFPRIELFGNHTTGDEGGVEKWNYPVSLIPSGRMASAIGYTRLKIGPSISRHSSGMACSQYHQRASKWYKISKAT